MRILEKDARVRISNPFHRYPYTTYLTEIVGIWELQSPDVEPNPTYFPEAAAQLVCREAQ